MPRYMITITGVIDSDDPDLAYLDNTTGRFRTPQDVQDYLTDVLAEELTLENTEVRVEEISDNAATQGRASK